MYYKCDSLYQRELERIKGQKREREREKGSKTRDTKHSNWHIREPQMVFAEFSWTKIRTWRFM